MAVDVISSSAIIKLISVIFSYLVATNTEKGSQQLENGLDRESIKYF